MAKVFATYIQNDEVTLETWSSVKAFETNEEWNDQKFIYIATSNDFKGKSSFPASPIYIEKLKVETEKPVKNGFNIILTPNEITAHNLMVEARNKYFNIKE